MSTSRLPGRTHPGFSGCMQEYPHIELQPRLLKIHGPGLFIMETLVHLSRVLPVLLSLAAVPAAMPQPSLLPASASTRLHFAQMADGGPSIQKWTTTLVLGRRIFVFSAHGDSE
jgi:hypothetical protein